MNKSEVCVKLTRKNCNKVLAILEMFGEKIFSTTKSRLEKGIIGWKYMGYNRGEWSGCSTNVIHIRTPVKPRELRNILAKEHLKEGDVAVFEDVDRNSEYVVKFDRCINGSFYGEKWIKSNVGIPCEGIICFRNFLRFATDKEKALLEPAKPVTYTREVWVNHYSDQEFHVHAIKEEADLSAHLNGNLGKHCQTVKATLTYDIPMTKV